MQGELDCAQQIRGVERLVQESGGTLTEGSLSNLIVIVGGDQDHRQLGILEPDAALQFESVDARHPHIRNQADRRLGRPRL